VKVRGKRDAQEIARSGVRGATARSACMCTRGDVVSGKPVVLSERKLRKLAIKHGFGHE